jgi:hypothetical protein
VRTPDFITFTGADDRTDVSHMAALSAQYPIEWGILLSRKRQGHDNRYPGGEAQSRLLWSGLRMSAHICGSYAQDIMDGTSFHDIPVDLGYFKRAQINHRYPDSTAIAKFGRGWGIRCIAQFRDSNFPAPGNVDWLFDASGGRGISPDVWPKHPGRLAGYAGGISPENVLSVIEAIGADGPYWIDMESGVRTDDWFDLDKCEAVCRAVFS